MFCPKCAAKNDDDLAYCRECGENLKIISQVMKGHAPLAIASKIDAVFQRKNERLRREAIFYTGIGLVTAIWTLVSGSLIPLGGEWPTAVGSIAFPIFFLYHGAANYLSYRRSLEIEGGPITNEKQTAVGDDAPEQKSAPGAQVFCAKCGTPNSEIKQFCSSCGFRLVFEPRGMEKYLPRFVIRWLDRRVRRNEEYLAVPRQGWRIVVLILAMVVGAIFMGLAGNTGTAALYAFIALSTLINSGWDYLTYIRTAKPEFVAKSEAYESPWQEFRAFLRKPAVKPKVWSILTLFVLTLVAPFVFASGTGLMFFPIFTMIFVASLVFDFKKFRHENRKPRIDNASELPTREMSSLETKELEANHAETARIAAADVLPAPIVSDTARFASPLGSVTEGTTKLLERHAEPESLETRQLGDETD